jgi:hypothetical protein
MPAFEHLLRSEDTSDRLDEIASADPPAYLRRCFAEGCSAPALSFARVQELALCAMVLDAIVNDRDYEGFETELIADWRMHQRLACLHLRELALAALHRARAALGPEEPEAAAELEELTRRLAPA